MSVEKITGNHMHAALANRVSDAINGAIQDGLNPAEACSVAANVVGDYWRACNCGTLTRLAEIVSNSDRRRSPVLGETKATH